MASIFKILRSILPRSRPPADIESAGSLYVNFADAQLGIMDNAGLPLDLLGVRYHKTTAGYVVNDIVAHGGTMFRCLEEHDPETFDPAKWYDLSADPETNHAGLVNVTPDQHHNQKHLLYGPDQSDVDTAAALAARHVLSRNTANNKFEPQYRTNFVSPYVLGPTYYPQDEVLDGVYLMAANKVTTERAAPQEIGLPSFIITDPVLWTNHSNAQPIHVGMHILVPAGKLYQISAYRIWAENINADYTYILWSITPDGSGGSIFEQKGKIAGDDLQLGWNQFSYNGGLLLPGVEADLILEISNSADGQTVTGGWTRTADHNNNPPGAQGWNKDNNSTILRISTTDLDSGDRQNELMSIVSGSEIRFVDTLDSQYSVTYAILVDPVLGTGVVTYTVSEVQQGPAGIPGIANTTTMTASIPTPSVVNYVDVAGKLSAYPNVTGRKSLTGSYADAIDTQDGYQFDIEVQELEASDDWDVKAISGGGGGSAGGGTFVPDVFMGPGTSGYVPDPGITTGKVLDDSGAWVKRGLSTTYEYHLEDAAMVAGDIWLEAGPPPFITVWRITNANESIILPLPSGFTYNFIVNYGDGTGDLTVNSFDDANSIHEYAVAGDYTVTIAGTCQAWQFSSKGTSKFNILDITQWGDVGFISLFGAFYKCQALVITATDNIGDNVTDLSYAFYDTTVNPNTTNWNISKVTTLTGIFEKNNFANPDVSNWDTGKVTTLYSSFFNASSVNLDVSGWDTSSVTDMRYTFLGCTSLVGLQISGFDVSSLTIATGFLSGTPGALTTEEYDATLIAWGAQIVNSGVNIDFNDAKYTPGGAAEAGRDALISAGWTVTDGGPV